MSASCCEEEGSRREGWAVRRAVEACGSSVGGVWEGCDGAGERGGIFRRSCGACPGSAYPDALRDFGGRRLEC